MRNIIMKSWIHVLILYSLFPNGAGAHGDMHERIAEAARQIENEPDRADLYFKRAELHRFHEEWDASLADFEQARSLDPQLPLLNLARARMLLEAGWPSSARMAVGDFLQAHPGYPEGLLVRARALAVEGQRLAAAADYSLAIERISKPGPEIFLERARLLAAEGGEHLTAAVAGLDEGMRRLGSLVTLQLYAIELELERGDLDAALTRVDAQAARSARKESWLVRRGDILRQAGRLAEAKAAYVEAIAAIESLPAGLRGVPMTAQLEARVRDIVDEFTL